MIDPADLHTFALVLENFEKIEEPKKRGRPVTGNALTPAQRSKAYRDRQKALFTELLKLKDSAP